MKIPGRGFLSGYRTQTLAYTAIVAMWVAYAVGAPVFGQESLGLGETLVGTVMALIAIFQRAGTRKAQKAAETSKPPVVTITGAGKLTVLLLASAIIVPMTSCAGKVTRDEVLAPALRLALEGVQADVWRGISDAVQDGDLTQEDSEKIRSRAAGLWFSINQEDRAAIAERLPVWAEVKPFAVRGVQDRVDDLEIGQGGAASRLERIDLFERALFVVTERL